MDQRGSSAPASHAGNDPRPSQNGQPDQLPTADDYGSYPPWEEYAEHPAMSEPPGVPPPDPTWSPPAWTPPNGTVAFTVTAPSPPLAAPNDTATSSWEWPTSGETPDGDNANQPDTQAADAAWAEYWARHPEYASDAPAATEPYRSDPTPPYAAEPSVTASFAASEQQPYGGYGAAPPYAPITPARDGRGRATGLIGLLIAVAVALAIAILAIAGWLAFGRGSSTAATPTAAFVQQATVSVPTAIGIATARVPSAAIAPNPTGPTAPRAPTALNVPVILPPAAAIASVAGATTLTVPVILPPASAIGSVAGTPTPAATTAPTAVPTALPTPSDQPAPTEPPATEAPATDVPIVEPPAPVVVNNPPTAVRNNPPPAPTTPPVATAVPTVAPLPTMPPAPTSPPPPTPAPTQKPPFTFPALPPTISPPKNTLPAGFAQPAPPRPISTRTGGG